MFLKKFSIVNHCIINISKLNFSSSLYSSKNLKCQKIFKFSKNSEDMKQVDDRKNYLENLKKIKNIKDLIKNEQMSSDQQAKSIKQEDEKSSYAKIEHLDKIRSLNSDLKKLIRENQILKANNSWGMEQLPINGEREQNMTVSFLKDVLSFEYSFNNRFLVDSFYEIKIDDSIPMQLRREEEELTIMQTGAENEIRHIVENMINVELKDLDVYKMEVPAKFASKPLLRTIPVIESSRGILLEKDFNVEFGLSLEYERIIKLQNTSDDFGRKIKEDDKTKEKEDDKHFINVEIPAYSLLSEGKDIIKTTPNSMIVNLSK